MQLPIVMPAPVVTAYAETFRDLFENRCQMRHFENYLTGLMVLPNKSLANIARCVLDSADKTNLSRFFAAAPWSQEQVNDRRVELLLERSASWRGPLRQAALLLDDTLCEHVGNLFEYVDRHYHHGEDSYPLAHNPVTSHYLSGAVRFPVDLRLYRRYEEITHWEEFVRKHYPQWQDQALPADKKARAQLHKTVDEELLKDPAFAALHESFKTKNELAVELIDQAVARQVPFSVVLMDAWYLAPEVIEAVRRHDKDWVSIAKHNRNLETNSFVLKDAAGQRVALAGPHIGIDDLVPLSPATAYRQVIVAGQSYWCFSLNVRIPTLGKVRLVISFENAQLTGRFVALVTNRVDWNAQQIITTYLQRWPIETFYQDSKTHLGLDEYRMRSAQAFEKHWCLVFVAYSLLHLDCLAVSPQKGAPTPHKTIGEACRQQAQALIQKLILHAHELLTQGVHAPDLFAQLFAKQGGMVAT